MQRWQGKEKHFFLRVASGYRRRRRSTVRLNDLSSSNVLFATHKSFSEAFYVSQNQVVQQQQLRTYMMTSSLSASHSRNMSGAPPPPTKQSIPDEEFEKLKKYLLQPIKEEPQVSEMKQNVRHIMQHHVYPTMPGQEAAVLVMIADAMDDYPFVIEVYHGLRNHSVPHSPMTLELTAYACAQTGEWQLASEVVENMHHAVDIMHPSYDIYENAIVACHQAKKWMKAMRLLEEMRTYGLVPPPEMFLKVLETCIECGEITATSRVLNDFMSYCEVEEPEEKQEYMEYLLEIAFKSKDPQHVMYLHTYMTETNPIVPVEKTWYQRMINMCLEQHAFSEARNLVYILKGDTKRIKIAFPSSNYTDAIFEVLEEMTNLDMDISLEAYNTVLLKCGRHGLYKEAKKLLDQMSNQGIEPDVTSYNAVIHACGEDQVDLAQEIWNEMIHYAKLVPNADTYQALLLVLSKSKQWQQVVDTFQELLHTKPDTLNQEATLMQVVKDSRILSQVAIANGKLKQYDQALDLFTQMKKEGLRPNLYVYVEAMRAYLHLNQPDRALFLFDHLFQQQKQNTSMEFPTTQIYETPLLWEIAMRAASVVATDDDNERATHLYHQMVRENVKMTPWTACLAFEVVPSVPTIDLWTKALEMPQLFINTQGEPNPIVMNGALKRAVEENDMDLSEQIVQDTQKKYPNVHQNAMSFSLRLRLYANNDQMEKFCKLCEEMYQDGAKPSIYTFESCMEYLLVLEEQKLEQTFNLTTWLRPVIKLLKLRGISSTTGEQSQLLEIGKQMLHQIQKRNLVCNAWILESFLCLCQTFEDVKIVLNILDKLDAEGLFPKEKNAKNMFYALFEVIKSVPNGPTKEEILEQLVDYQKKLPDEVWTGALGGFCSQVKEAEDIFHLVANVKTISPQQAHIFLMALNTHPLSVLKDVCHLLKDQNVSLTLVSCAFLIRKLATEQATLQEEWMEQWLRTQLQGSTTTTRSSNHTSTRDTMQRLLNSTRFQNIEHSPDSIQKAQEILIRILA